MNPFLLSRRDVLQRMGTGLGTLGLAAILQEQGLLASEAPAANTSGSPLAPKRRTSRPRPSASSTCS